MSGAMEARDAQIVADYAGGPGGQVPKGIRELADQHHLSHTRVWTILKNNGVERRPACFHRDDWSAADRKMLGTMMADGKSERETAAALGRSKAAVVAAKKRYGITKAKAPRAKRASRAKVVAPVVAALPQQVKVPKPIRRATAGRHSCQFPFGDPKRAGFRFCEAATEVGRVYCTEHHVLCHQRVAVEAPHA